MSYIISKFYFYGLMGELLRTASVFAIPTRRKEKLVLAFVITMSNHFLSPKSAVFGGI